MKRRRKERNERRKGDIERQRKQEIMNEVKEARNY
jgi:hypothetical protein